MIILGLTGSIGMGKSTTAGLFSAEGVPVNDADQVVHALYRDEAVQPVGEAFPGTVKDGVVDRQELARQLSARLEGAADVTTPDIATPDTDVAPAISPEADTPVPEIEPPPEMTTAYPASFLQPEDRAPRAAAQ